MKKKFLFGVLAISFLLITNATANAFTRARKDDLIKTVTATPTISTGIYADGDLLGTKMSLNSAAKKNGGAGLIQSVTIIDLDKEDANIDVIFFEGNPSGTTFTDNTALDIADADMSQILGFTTVTDYADFSDNSVAFSRNLAIPFDLDSGKILYACLVVRGTPTYTATSDIILDVNIIQE